MGTPGRISRDIEKGVRDSQGRLKDRNMRKDFYGNPIPEPGKEMETPRARVEVAKEVSKVRRSWGKKSEERRKEYGEKGEEK